MPPHANYTPATFGVEIEPSFVYVVCKCICVYMRWCRAYVYTLRVLRG